jgi:integrase
LAPLWETKPETAGRVRGRIEAVLSYAAAHRWRGSDNPARWRGHLDAILPARSKVRRVKHHAALDYRALPEFMAALREQPGVAARALAFAILTVARTGEVLGAQWREFDIDGRLWVVPPVRMKAGREHRVPLSVEAGTLAKRKAGTRTIVVTSPAAYIASLPEGGAP